MEQLARTWSTGTARACQWLEIRGQILLRHLQRDIVPLYVLHVLRQVAHHLRGIVSVQDVRVVQAALVLLLQRLVVVRGLGAAVVGLVVVRVHRRLRHLAVCRTTALLFGAACTTAEEGLVEMAVQVLRCLALELRFRVLVRA